MRILLKSAHFPCYTLILFLAAQFFGCASIQQPTGGPRDSVAPTILKEDPKNFTTNFKFREINISFDEYFKLSNEFKEISVSPAMEKNPQFNVKKKTLNVEFQEPLQENTTYTINFGNALIDYNEGNILKNYIYVFSTGNDIDSLSIGGTVKNTLTKEPVLDATVFILPAKQDSLFGKKRASIFTTTDSSGNFKLKYLREDVYRIYAIKEQNGDRIYNSPNEEIGFANGSITLQKDTAGISLELFKQEPKSFRVTDRKIEKDGRIAFAFNKRLVNPSLEIIQPLQLNNTKITEFNTTRDSAYLWTSPMDFDSLTVAIQDSKTNLDTVILRRSKRDSYNTSLLISDNVPSGKLKPGADLMLTVSAPFKSIDPKKIKLLQDSVPVTGLRIAKDSLSSRRVVLKYPWKPEKQYTLTIGEDGFSGLYAGTSKTYNKQFVRDVEDNYGTLTARVSVPDTTINYVFEILDEKLNAINSVVIKKNSTLNFPMMNIGKYSIRVSYDENKNGKWDTGDVMARKQPEKVWNYPTQISLRANFDLEENVTIPKAP